MFKPSAACRPPHLNVDVLRNEVRAGCVRVPRAKRIQPHPPPALRRRVRAAFDPASPRGKAHPTTPLPRAPCRVQMHKAELISKLQFKSADELLSWLEVTTGYL